MRLVKIARQLLDITEYLEREFYHVPVYDNGILYDFDQPWASTALGFGGIGGSALTTERTYVFIPHGMDIAYVFFGGRFAYKCKMNDIFWDDVNNCRMASVIESERYNK